MTTTPTGALGVAAIVTVVVTIASHALPGDHANLAVAATFLGATWWLVLRKDADGIRAHGLSLGGLFEPEALDPRRLARALLIACGWTAAVAAVTFPPFAIGYAKLWAPARAFAWSWPSDWLDRIAGQLVVVALPEEAFFRGYLQTALEDRWGRPWRVLGADLGPGWIAASVIFAVGHVLTVPQPARLAVFLPALVFGWLRARTGGIGASMGFHAACNLLSSALALGYGVRAR